MSLAKIGAVWPEGGLSSGINSLFIQLLDKSTLGSVLPIEIFFPRGNGEYGGEGDFP